MICPLPLELLLEMTRSDLKAFSFSVTFPLAMNEKSNGTTSLSSIVSTFLLLKRKVSKTNLIS